MEKFLEKISESPYRENFVLKGGFLIGSKYGIENRTTKDIDTTLREMKVTKETLTTVLNEIFSTPTKEGIQFEIQGMKKREKPITIQDLAYVCWHIWKTCGQI